MQQLVVRLARVLQDEGVEAQPRVVDGGEHDLVRGRVRVGVRRLG